MAIITTASDLKSMTKAQLSAAYAELADAAQNLLNLRSMPADVISTETWRTAEELSAQHLSDVISRGPTRLLVSVTD